MSEFDDRVAHIQAEWRQERPDIDVAPQGVIGRLHRLAGHLTEALAVVYRAHGLSEADFDVLATLRRAGAPYERTAGELARWTMLTTGGLTKRLDRLEGAGLISRRVSETDGRSRVIALTERGRGVIDEAFEAHMANERQLVASVSDTDREVLERILAGWLSRFE